jgi:hypothetical protein
MPFKCLKGRRYAAFLPALLVPVVAPLLLSACSTPFDASGGLCAPNQANTSACQAHPRAAELAPALPANPPAALPSRAAPPPAEVQTTPVDDPNAAVPAAQPRGGEVRIALLLPLRSEALGQPADALRAGFMAAHERDRAGFAVTVVETGDSPQETVDAYKAALASNDLVVGPLARSAVGAVAASGAVTKPTIALNHPDLRGDAALPARMLVMGLSIEDEARQTAQWAANDHPGARALIVSGTNAWQRRIAGAFAAHWKQLGNQSQLVELADSNGYLSETGINQLRTRIDAEPPDVLLTALDAGQLRQVRGALGQEVPVYATSSGNPGIEPGQAMSELDGVHVLDMPWQVQPDHPAVMVYPRWAGTRRTLDLDRLYALGIDAYRVAREIGLKSDAAFEMDGVTGRLRVQYGQGAARFERQQPTVVYLNGAFKTVGKQR